MTCTDVISGTRRAQVSTWPVAFAVRSGSPVRDRVAIAGETLTGSRHSSWATSRASSNDATQTKRDWA